MLIFLKISLKWAISFEIEIYIYCREVTLSQKRHSKLNYSLYQELEKRISMFLVLLSMVSIGHYIARMINEKLLFVPEFVVVGDVSAKK